MSSTPSEAASRSAPSIVLDTNVILDWLVFRNPASVELSERIESGEVQWLVSTDTRNELQHVLGRGIGAAFQPNFEIIWSTWDRLAVAVEPAPVIGAAARMRCTDPDDQKFIDLALAHRARWLLSRDRAVLKLAKRGLPLGLQVLTPERWLASISVR